MEVLQLDWNVIGVDLISRLLPVVVLVAVYYVKELAARVPPLVVNIVALVLMEVTTLVNALLQNGTWNPVKAALLTGLVTLLAEVLKNIGANQVVKKVLFLGAKQ